MFVFTSPVDAEETVGSEKAAGSEKIVMPIRVMSFNIRYGSARDKSNHWNLRKDFVVETIQKFNPDLLGTQETLDFQKDYLTENLQGYESFGVGRDDGGKKGEMMAIFYRTDRFEKVDGGHAWYSLTPNVPGSVSWDSSLPRMVSWVTLKDLKNGGKTLTFFNTHFDHKGEKARVESARILRQLVAKHADTMPVVVTGDFNSAEASDPYQALFARTTDLGLLDTYRMSHPQREDNEQTSGGFEANKSGHARIDWIACTKSLEVKSSNIDRTSRDGRTPSDHYPVNAVLAWPVQQVAAD